MQPITPRALTKQEIAWIKTIVAKEDPKQQQAILTALKNIKVEQQCICDNPQCHSIRFSTYRKGKSIAFAQQPIDNKRTGILFVDQENQQPTEVEII